MRVSTLVTLAASGVYCASTVYFYGHDWPAAFLIIVGAGLGFATADRFVNQSGGRISVSSIAGAGTSFEALLPRCGKAVAPRIREEPQQILRGTERILVMDDEPALRGLLRQTMAGYGYGVLAAANGEEALAVVARAEDPPDLLVTDVIMPGLNRPQLATRLRAILPDIGVLFISRYPGETEADREAFGPGSSYLATPSRRRACCA